MWDAIMDRREVGILSEGRMMGPAAYRNALEMLLLDRVYLEEYFGDRIDLRAETDNNTLNISISNSYAHAVSGSLDIKLPPGLNLATELPADLVLPANSTKTIRVSISTQAEAMNKTNPVAVRFHWAGRTKTTLTILDLPPAISIQRLLFGFAPKIKYPVSIHNFSSASTYPV